MVTANIGTIRRLGRIFGALSAAAPPLLPIGLGEWADRVYSRAIAEQFLGSWRQRDALDVLPPFASEHRMSVWLVILILFASIGVFCTTWKLGEWLSRRKAERFAERRESWRALELPQRRDSDRVEG